MTKREPSVLEVALSRGGFRKGTKACRHAITWGLWLEATPGEDLSTDRRGSRWGPPRERRMEDYAAWWGRSRGQVYKDQQVFREVFPEFDDPTALWSLVRERVELKATLATQVAQLGSVAWAC